MFLVLLLRLGVLQTFAESEHASAAILVVSAIVIVAQSIARLCCFHEEQHALMVGIERCHAVLRV